MVTQTIQFGDEGQAATREMVRHFEELASERADLVEGPLHRYFMTLQSIDREYGGSGTVDLEDARDLIAATLAEIARVEARARSAESDQVLRILADLAVGVALWAMRHDIDLAP